MECCFLCETIDDKRTLCSSCAKLEREANKNLVLHHRKILDNINAENKRLRELVEFQVKKQCPTSILNSTKSYNVSNATISPTSNPTKSTLSYLSECISRDKEEIQKIRNNMQQRKITLEKAKKELDKKKQDFQDLDLPKYSDQISQLRERCAKELVTHRRALIGELLSFLPVNPSPTSEKESIIINIILPNNGVYSLYPAAALTAALGYVAHLVYLVSCYLNVVPPHRLVYNGSRSYMVSSDDPPKLFPLYGTRVPDMETGLHLLNRDVVYLCASQGIIINKIATECTLPNMMALLRSPTTGWPAPYQDQYFNIYLQQKPKSTKRIVRATTLPVTLKEKEESEGGDGAGDEDSDFIVVDHSIPTPSQAEDLAHFERALFIDKS